MVDPPRSLVSFGNVACHSCGAGVVANLQASTYHCGTCAFDGEVYHCPNCSYVLHGLISTMKGGQLCPHCRRLNQIKEWKKKPARLSE